MSHTATTDERPLPESERRRAVVCHLAHCEGAVRLRDVAEQVAAWEHDAAVGEVRAGQRRRVSVSLYRTHLPALDEAGVVEYSKPRGVVVPTPAVDRLAATLEEEPSAGTAEGSETEWAAYYLAVVGVTASVSGGVASRAWPFSTLSTATTSTLAVGLFGALTVATLLVEHAG